MGLCKLCGKDRALVEGHILSEFLYADLYDQNHKFHQLHTNIKKRNVRRPKGYYERLLCAQCDGVSIGGYESYASQVLIGGVEIPIQLEQSRIVVDEVDYAKFKLFQLSLLWRSVISTLKVFEAADVTPEHAERMRLMLLNSDPGEPYDYGCILMIPKMHSELRQAIIPPEPVRACGHRFFRLLAGGFWWLFLVSSHAHRFEHRELFLSRQGTLSIIKESGSTSFIRSLAVDLVKNPTFPITT